MIFQWPLLPAHTKGDPAKRAKNKEGSRIIHGTREVEHQVRGPVGKENRSSTEVGL